MRVRSIPPYASTILESLRGLGYTTSTALADLIDNSISAKANNIFIDFHWDNDESWIRVTDDGCGMNDATLEAGMRLGAYDPRRVRSEGDLGRFGFGLKTASLSQGRRLTVASHMEGEPISCLRWDLDLIGDVAGVEWPLFEGAVEGSEIALEALNSMESGTIVLIEKLDRVVTVGFGADDLLSLINEVESHLAMTFHDLLSSPARPLSIFINNRKIKAWDPFLTNHPSKALESTVYRIWGINGVKVQSHVLPHKDMLSPVEQEKAAGPKGWVHQEGFYVYRNKRLLVAGGWLGLGDKNRAWVQDEAHRLVRIRIDIPNSADSDWKINILKSTASPPVKIREQLVRIAVEARDIGRKVFAHRGFIFPVSGTNKDLIAEDLWQAKKSTRGTSYHINMEHELVASILERSGVLKQDIRSLLKLIEKTVPVQRIWLDTAEDKEVPQNGLSDMSPEETKSILTTLYRVFTEQHKLAPEQAKERLKRTPPFTQCHALISELS